MSWVYHQSNGRIEQDGVLVDVGYSGHGEGKNNPEMESVHDVGPIPRGHWKIVGPPVTHPKLGPYVLDIEPKKGTETFGRTGFHIHGDSKTAPGTASHGCIVAARATRIFVWTSGDTDLEVV